MPKQSDGNFALTGFDEIFKSNTEGLDGERIDLIPIADLHPPEYHPFLVLDDESMTRLTENIKRYGVREPGLARPLAGGAGTSCAGYELLCGNRRKRACELAGITAMPVIIRDLDDNAAAIAMVDSNLEQRESLLPSEKAWAYRVKLEALNHSGIKGDGLSVDVLTEQTGESRNQIFRLVRLTELVPDLLDKVDAKQLAFTVAVELSYLTRPLQAAVVDAMAEFQIKPSLSQAVLLKKKAQAGELTADMIREILSKAKKRTETIKGAAIYRAYFPADYSPEQMDAVIVELLTAWKEGA